MNIYDFLILAAVALVVAGVIIYLVRLKKKGKSVCCGDCSRCGANCDIKK